MGEGLVRRAWLMLPAGSGSCCETSEARQVRAAVQRASCGAMCRQIDLIGVSLAQINRTCMPRQAGSASRPARSTSTYTPAGQRVGQWLVECSWQASNSNMGQFHIHAGMATTAVGRLQAAIRAGVMSMRTVGARQDGVLWVVKVVAPQRYLFRGESTRWHAWSVLGRCQAQAAVRHAFPGQ